MKTKKTNKPEFTVNLSNCETPEDIYAAFGYAKQQAGLPMEDIEFWTIILKATQLRDVCELFVNDFITELAGVTEPRKCSKKPNIFKRFWNWITRKNKKTADDQLK